MQNSDLRDDGKEKKQKNEQEGVHQLVVSSFKGLDNLSGRFSEEHA
jgi:hypothetical protein